METNAMQTKISYLIFVLLHFSLSYQALAKSLPENDFTQLAHIKTAIQPYVNDGFAGSIVVANEFGTIFSQSYGQAVPGVANFSTSTVVDIASVSKQFTAAAIMRLVEDGLMDTSDLMSQYIENVPEDKVDITIHHLLTHSAGFKRDAGRDEEAASRVSYEYKAMASKLAFGVGEQYHYSNIGYNLLAIIVEKVSKMRFEDYLFVHLFKPAGMFSTGYLRPDWSQYSVAEITEPYKGYKSQLELNQDLEDEAWNFVGSGGILSTADDMVKWHVALSTGKIISYVSQELMFSPHVKEYEEGYFYGYGWSIVPFKDRDTLVWHNGMSFFGKAEYWRIPEQKLMIFVASNRGEVEPWSVANALYQTLYQQK